MSAPHRFAVESRNIGYGLLAASLAETLKLRSHSELDDFSVERLGQAVEFLNEVVRGGKLVTRGECGALTTERSIEALGYAMEPIAVLQGLVATNEELVGMFQDMADYFARIAKARFVYSTDDRDKLQLGRATIFFDALAQRILSSLSTARVRKANAFP